MPAPPNYSSYHHSKYPPPTTNNSSTNNNNTNNTGRTSPQHANINIHPPSTTPESLALSRLRLPSISHPQQQCQTSIYVPSYTVGAVIGRGGRTILNVQREAMRRSLGHAGSVRISVLGGNGVGSGGGGGEDNGGEFVPPSSTASTTTTSHKNPSSPWNYHEYYHSVQTNAVAAFEDDDNHDAPERRNDDENDDDNNDDYYTPIIIRGDPVGCFAALRQLLPLVDHAHDPHIVFEVPVHRSKHGLLLGVRGLVLASLSAMFHVRIRIPPNGTGGGENHGYWQPPQQQQQQPPQQQQQQQLHGVYGSNAGGNDIGSTMLFPEANVVHHNPISNDVVVPASSSTPLSSSSSHSPPSTTTPPNVIQLEGEIDNVEQCLVKMLSIVAGEPYFPTGVIVHCGTVEKDGTNEYNITNNSNTGVDCSRTGSSHSKESTATPATHPGESNMKAVAVLTATQHNNNNNNSISQNKFRSIQRKTNTLIRRKKGRFRFNGVEYGGRTGGSDPAETEEGEGESAALVMNDNDDVEEEDEEEEKEEDADDDALATAGGKIIPISFVVSGKVENVKAAVQQLEKLLGLEPYSTVISLREVPFKGNGGGEENSPTSKSNDGGSGGGGASVENEKKKRNQRNKAKRKPMKNQKEGGGVLGNRLDGDSG